MLLTLLFLAMELRMLTPTLLLLSLSLICYCIVASMSLWKKTQQIQNLETLLEKCDENLKIFKNRVETYEGDIQDLLSKIDTEKAENLRVQDESANFHQKWIESRNVVSKLEKQISDYDKESDNLMQQILILGSQGRYKDEKIQDLSRDINSLQSNFSEIQAQNETMKMKIEILQSAQSTAVSMLKENLNLRRPTAWKRLVPQVLEKLTQQEQ